MVNKLRDNESVLRTGWMLILLLLLGVGILPAQTASVWDGTVPSTAGVSKSVCNGIGITGSGTEADPYVITTAGQFAYFASKANGNTNWWVLGADIDLNGSQYEWTYGKNSASNFRGHLDGKTGSVTHTISNVRITPTSAKNNGLFSSLQGSANSRMEMKNLIIDGVTIEQSGGLAQTTTIGALAGNVTEYVDIENVTVSNVSVNLAALTNTNYVGAFAGRVQQNNCTIKNCTIENPELTIGTLSNGASYVGGAIGQISGTAGKISSIDGFTVTDPAVTVNKVSIKDCYIGGVFGRISTYSDVKTVSVSSPTLTYNNADDPNVAINLGSFAGGILGVAALETSVTDVTATGDARVVLGTGSSNVANMKVGLVGYATTKAVLDDWNVANTSVVVNGNLANATSYIGGFVGNAVSENNASTIISNVTMNEGTIEVKGNVATACHIGGLAGNIAGALNGITTIEKISLNTSDITITGNVSVGSYFGGMVGQTGVSNKYKNRFADCKINTATNLTFEGNITAQSHVGGVFGSCQGNAGYPVEAEIIKVTNPTILFKGTTVTTYVGGISGQINTNVSLTNVLAESPKITFNNPISVLCHVGGGIGYFAGGSFATPSKLDGIAVDKANLTINGITIKDASVGGVFGRINTYSTISNVSASESSIVYNGNIAVATHIGDVAGYVTGNAMLPTTIDEALSSESSITINGNVTANALNLGGIAGYQTTVANITNAKVENTQLAFNGNVTGGSLYIGGVTGYQTSASTLGATVDGVDIALNGNNASNMYVGGAVGYMANAASPITTLEQAVVKNANIHTVGSHTYAKSNKPLVVGGVVGYMAHSTATNRSEVNKCVTQDININLSGFTPEAANTSASGNQYNQQQNAVVVGGVIGRINTPYSLPEHLYFSGKIYAPFAVVGPVVGMFLKKIDAASYLYDDYSGVNASNISSAEWDKANTWYFSDYRLGLSPELTAASIAKNYTASTTTIGSIEYLKIEDNTLTATNSISGTDKKSKTILAYTATTDITPAWNAGGINYPSYYMYYLQGVNRGTYNNQIDIDKVLIGFAFAPEMRRSGNDESGYVFTIDLNGFEPGTDYTITYQWYQSDKTTAIGGATSGSFSASKAELDAMGGSVYCVVTVDGADITPVSTTLKGAYFIVVFVDGVSGVDNVGNSRDRGWTPAKAVRTLNHANTLLASAEEGGTIDNNYIVIINTLNSGTAFVSWGTNPATLTGKWDDVDYGGIIVIDKVNGEDDVNKVNQAEQRGHHCYVKADTKFEYLTFSCKNDGNDNNFIECHGHDVWFGKGLVMTNFRNLTKGHGNLEAAQNIPELTVLLTATNLSEEDIQAYTNRTKPQTLTIESGHYGRILGGRFTNAFFGKEENTSHTILGSAEHPIWAVVNINIDRDNPNTGTVKRSENPDSNITVTNNFTCDINCIIAGLTDGTMYGDFTINVRGGNIGYIVGGNQGNPVPNGSKTFVQPGGKSGNWGQWPNASYFGRTVINVEQDPDLKDVTIDNLYAGGLGRAANGSSATSIVDMYMYGHTEINLKSGTINGNVYGGGAGGVIGVNPWDMHVPYATTAADNATDAVMNKVQYGTWGSMPAGSPLTNVTLHNPNGNGGYTTEILDLDDSETTINISGGTINGSVYGGGCGYVSNMPKEVCMQGVGSVFGISNVNISGGTILGSVYGGSEGSDKYYDATNKYNQRITHIAEMNGTVNLHITGNNEIYPTISGNIYGAGMGIASNGDKEYLRIATAGNADLGEQYKTNINILIDLPESHPFLGNVYGGGEKGAVDGNIHVTINGGVLGSVEDGNVENGNVFGGGKGEPGHPNKAKVNGRTYLNIDLVNGGEVLGNVYGGGELA